MAKAVLTVGEKKIEDIKCEILLPNDRIGKIKIRLYPVKDAYQEILPYFKFVFDAKTEEVEFHSDNVNIIKGESKYYDQVWVENYIELEANGFLVAKNIASSIQQHALVQFWISPNDKINVKTIIEKMQNGSVNVTYCHPELLKFKLCDNMFLQFDKMYDYEKNGKGYTATPYLVAVITGSFSFSNINEVNSMLSQRINEFLLLVSFAFRTRIVWTGFETIVEGKLYSYYRGNCSFPDGQSRDSLNDGVILYSDFKEFMDQAYIVFEKSEYKDSLRKAIFVLCPGNNQNILVEENYLMLFAALESIVLIYRKLNNKEFILPEIECRKLSKAIRKIVKDQLDDKIKRNSLYSKIPELNRVALRNVFNDFCKAYNIDLSSLWKVFEENDKKPGLSDIRNKLIHGDTQEMFGFLSYAHQHLEYILERIICKLLNWSLDRTEINSSVLKRNVISVNKFSLIKEEVEVTFKTLK